MALRTVLLLCALVCVVAADILVDDFTVTSPKLVLGSIPQSNSVIGTSIIGGERDLRIQGTSSGCTQSFPEASVDGNQKAFLLSNPSTTVNTCFGSATVQYDGTDGSSNLQQGLNLNLASATSFDLTIANDNNPGIRYTIRLFSGANNVCTNTFEFLGQGTTVPVVRSIPLSAFSTGCTLGNIGAIEVTLEGGTDNDQNVRLIQIRQPVAGAITANVFDDCDCNGSQGTGESSRSGITVSIAGAGACSSVTQSSTTSSSGTVSFTGLQAGCSFAVAIQGQTLCSGATNTRTVTIVASQTQVVNYGIFCPPKLGAITVNVFDDCDCNGSQGTGESARSGISISVAGQGACSTTSQTSQTGTSGTVTFNGLNAGCTFAVAIVGQTLCTGASATQSVTVAAGATSVVSYGIFCPPKLGAITVNVFDDCDCNGSQGTGESARSGVSISLAGQGACSTTTQTSQTGTSGTVTFNGLNAGCTFAVAIVGQTLCTGASTTQSVTVAAGATSVVSYGIFCPPKLGAITVNVFDDCDCNGSQGTGESARSNINIALAGAGACSGVTQTSQTGSSGTVTFNGLNAGCTFAVTIQGQTLCTGASTSQSVTIAAGATSVVSYGIFCPPKTGDLTGIVFQDCECDGVQGTGDNGVNGVTVSLTSNGATQATTTTTANSGTFAFGGLLAGTYTVSVNSATCGTLATSKSVTVVAGATQRVEFSTPAPTCAIVAPPPAAVKCGGSTSESATGSPTVTGGCVATAVDGPASQACDPSVCGFSQTFTRTWTVTSACGGSRTASQTITVSACQPGACPPCNNAPNSPVAPVSPIAPNSPVFSSVAPASPNNPAPNSPNSPNAPRNCRRVCDDGSSSAASVGASLVLAFVALIAAFLF